jgi:hypothetical protein
METEQTSATLAEKLHELQDRVGAALFHCKVSFDAWTVSGCKDERAYQRLQGDGAALKQITDEFRELGETASSGIALTLYSIANKIERGEVKAISDIQRLIVIVKDSDKPRGCQLRIVLDAAKPQVILDGVSYNISYPVAEFLQACIDADGTPVSMTKYGVRTRDVKALAEPLRNLIVKKSGSGSCIPRENLRFS